MSRYPLGNGASSAWVVRSLEISSAAAASAEESFISYPEADDVLTQCEWRIISPQRLLQPHLALIADRQNGKGAIVRWVCRRHRPFRVASIDNAVVPVVVSELPMEPRSEALVSALASALGLLRCANWTSLQRRYRSASVRLVFFRNMHELLDWSPIQQQSVLRQVLEFSESAGLGLVFCGMPSFNTALTNHKDLIGGVPRFTLPPWNATSLSNFLKNLEQAWGLPPSSISRHAGVLAELGKGCIGDIMGRIRYAVANSDAGCDVDRMSKLLLRSR